VIAIILKSACLFAWVLASAMKKIDNTEKKQEKT
jgi:hypothetical protein